MEKADPVRRLQILLHPTCSTDAARAEAKRLLSESGMQLSGEGDATLSARMPDDAFRKLFASGSDGALVVPARLQPFVAAISEAPQHLSF